MVFLSHKAPRSDSFPALPGYRIDIEGMRGVAVSLVVLFHCGFVRFVPGGFIGVDVFFVISGYLITGDLVRRMDAGRFSFIDFYSRRILRICPAIAVLYVVLLLVGALFLMPLEQKSLSTNMISSLLLVSNVYFYSQSGYFDHVSEFNTLLHTWSLSLEEQFYFIIPVALYLLTSCARRYRFIVIVCITIASLAASSYVVLRDQSSAFYLLPYRAWELLVGSLLALRKATRMPSMVWAEALALGGVFLIAVGAVKLSAALPFPGIAAMVPVVGTALVLYSGETGKTFVGTLIDMPPMNYLGRISYSLYLWHWPVWVLVRGLFMEPHHAIEYFVFICVSILIAFLSWKYIERPFQSMSNRVRSVRVLTGYGVATIAILFATVSCASLSNLFWQVPAKIEKVETYLYYNADQAYRANSCFLTSTSPDVKIFDTSKCLSYSRDKRNVLLLGDSHAAQLYAGLAIMPNINVMQATASGCKPLLPLGGASWCRDLFREIFSQVMFGERPLTIILSARWQVSDIPNLLKTIETLQQHAQIVVIGPVPEYDVGLPRIMALSLFYKDGSMIARHRQHEPKQTDAALRAALQGSAARYLSIIERLCTAEDCETSDQNGNPIQFDYGHLTAEGSKKVIALLSDRLISASGLEKAGDGLDK